MRGQHCKRYLIALFSSVLPRVHPEYWRAGTLSKSISASVTCELFIASEAVTDGCSHTETAHRRAVRVSVNCRYGGSIDKMKWQVTVPDPLMILIGVCCPKLRSRCPVEAPLPAYIPEAQATDAPKTEGNTPPRRLADTQPFIRLSCTSTPGILASRES